MNLAIQTISNVFAQLRKGALPFEAFNLLLEKLITIENYPLALHLYSDWCAYGQKVTNHESSTIDPLLVKLKKYHPGLPNLPLRDDWLQIQINGQTREYRDITDQFFIGIIGEVQKHTITMLEGAAAPWALYQAIEYIVKNNIPGDLVECGVWNGGSVLLIAQALIHFGDTDRRIYLYDTFEGMPKPDDVDRDWNGIPALPTWEAKRQDDPDGPNWGFGGTLEMVQEVVYSSGYPKEKFVFVKGLVENTLPGHRPEKLAILRLDTDFYSSTYHELVHLYPGLVTGGVLMIDDYGYFQGARLATDQYIAENNLKLYLSRVDQSVRVAIKLGLSQ